MNALEIVIPVHNEHRILERSVRTLHAYLSENFTIPFQITIADNASDDATLYVARILADEIPDVGVLYLDRKGRGHALRVAWMRSDADVLAYMDATCRPTVGSRRARSPTARRTRRPRDRVRLAPGAQVRAASSAR